MKTEKQIELLEKRLKEEKEFLSLIKELEGSLPDIGQHEWNRHACYCDAELRAEMEFNDALTWAEKVNPLGIYKCKDSCLSFRPEGRLGEFEDPNDRQDVWGCGPYILEIENYSKTDVFLICFFELESKVIKFSIKIKNHGCRIWCEHKKVNDRFGERFEYIQQSSINPEIECHFLQRATFWASEGTAGRRIYHN